MGALCSPDADRAVFAAYVDDVAAVFRAGA
jgi:hypothetical protein